MHANMHNHTGFVLDLIQSISITFQCYIQINLVTFAKQWSTHSQGQNRLLGKREVWSRIESEKVLSSFQLHTSTYLKKSSPYSKQCRYRTVQYI